MTRPPVTAVRAVVVEGFFTRLGFGMVTFALPLYGLSIGMNVAEVGLLAGARALVEPVVKPLAGRFVDRYGIRRGYLCAVSIRLMGSVLLFAAASPAALLGVRFLQGAASAARDPASISLIARQSNLRLGRAFSATIGARDLGNVLAGVLAGGILVVTGGSFKVLWAVVAVLAVIPVVAVHRWVAPDDVGSVDVDAEPKPVAEPAVAPPATQVLVGPARSISASQTKPYPAPTPEAPDAEDPMDLDAARRRLRLIGALGLFAGLTAHMTHGLFQVYATEVGGLSPGQVGLIYSLSVLTLLVTGPAFGWAADRFGTGPLLPVRGLANALSSMLYLVAPSFAGILAARFVDDTGKAAFRPTWGTLMASIARSPGANRSRAMANVDTLLSIGEALGPVLAGILWSWQGVVALFAVRAFLGLATELFIGRRLRCASPAHVGGDERTQHDGPKPLHVRDFSWWSHRPLRRRREDPDTMPGLRLRPTGQVGRRSSRTMTASAAAERTDSRTRLRQVLRGARLRILGWYVVLLAGSSLVSALVAYQVLDARLTDEIEAGLVQEARELERLASGNNPRTGQPFGDDVAAVFDTFLRRNIPGEGEALFTLIDGRPYKASDNPRHDLLADQALVARWSALASSERSTINTPAGDARYLAVPLRLGDRQLGVFVVANFRANEQDEILQSVRVVGAVSVVVLLVASILAWLAAGRVLAPVRLLTATARRITDTDFSRRIPVTGSDEIAELTTTFNDMLDRLEDAFASQRDFISDAGHELRTPITIIRGHLELMGDDPDERRETIDLVTDELDRMARYVGDLLLLAKAERPDFLQREPVDLAELTQRLFAKAQAFDPERFRLAETGRGTAFADPDRLTQAVMNLAHNAVHHAEGGGEITLGSHLSNGHARFWVHDTGPGIPAADQDRLFDRFARGEASARRDGTGLGLAIVAAIGRAHGGRVDLVSQPDAGTTFTLVIPVHPQSGSKS